MIYFELEPLSTLADRRHLLAYVEVHALASGFSGLDDIDLDQDALTQAYIESLPKIEREDLREEPQHAFTILREQIEAAIIEETIETEAVMGADYPFLPRSDPGILLELKPKGDITAFGWCYIALQIFALDQRDHLAFRATHEHSDLKDPRAYFRRVFYPLFELMAGVVVANDHAGIPVFLSDCRSASALLRRLGYACELFQKGTVKQKQQLDINEADANDGGIDAIVGVFGETGLQRTIFVAATVQKENLRKKMIGRDEVDRLLGFLVSPKPWRPCYGTLVHPEPFDEGVKLMCAEKNCGYLAREHILSKLRKLSAVPELVDQANHDIQLLIRSRMKPFRHLRFQREFDFLRLAK